ncbi:MAG: cupredoxin domain-containing protein [Limnochordaceae bacterium]|uniref:Cupredoxin domain-containing protein n=1 Tax=Carboxydichorda subterranea TaxID=3109565 RepID=A0ABZ1BVB1_9FIRM|nr:cupredoxin domain-containing protein [Limnochorda sp. L945t]MBE3597381.1 cupredoxin domain-containing protein [Limnochordaceae bacterium]WRP16430.1 cupredoxin domain-containing protein [Limnochorda sp. L945t]
MKRRGWVSRFTVLGVLLVALAVLAAACGGGGGTPSSSSSSAPTTSGSSQTASPTPPAETASPSGSTAASGGSSGSSIEVVATDEGGQFKFIPADIEAKPGQPITVKVVNKGPSAHDWAVPDLKVETGQLQTGQEKTLTFQAPSKPGEYNIMCTVPGHAQLGMTGKLIVR